MWQEIVKKKYVKKECITQIKHKQTDSRVWSDLLKVRDLYLENRLMKVGNGENTDFWNEKWCGNFSLRERFKSIFDICQEQKITVAELYKRRWRLTFRRWLTKDQQVEKRKLNDILATCLSNRDTPIWNKEKSGKFTVKSMYNQLFGGSGSDPNKEIWEAKLLL